MRGAYRLRWVSDVALIERAEELLAAQGESVAALVPEGCRLFDAHTHLGLDEDGHSLSVAQHLRLMDEAGVSAANVFALNEPDREPAYRAPNDRVLALGRRGAGSAVPVRAAEPRRGRGSAAGGRALPRAGRARHQAAPARTGVPGQRPASRGRLRPGRRAAAAGAHPRRSRPATGYAAGARARGRATSGRLPDPGARRDRCPGPHRRAGAQRREHLLRQLDLDAARPAQPALARAAGADPVGLRHPVRRAARGAQRVRARGAQERRRRRRFCAACWATTRAACSRGAARSALGAAGRRRSIRTSYARARASMYMAAATTLLWIGMPERVGFLGLAEAALHEEGLDEQAELVRCTAALWAQWAATVVPERAAGPGRPRPRLPAPQCRPGEYGSGMTEVTLTLNGRERQHERPRGRDAGRAAARAGRPDRHEDRLRRGHVRRLHRARRRARGALVHPARRAGRGLRGDDDRGPRRRGRAVGAAARVRRGGCVAVRVLHGRAGRLRDRAAGGDAAADERAGARGHERQSLPLRRLPGHRACRAARRRGAGRRD